MQLSSGFLENTMATTRSFILYTLILFFASCNVIRVIKPLEKGEKQLSAGLGGPGIIYAGAPIPMPLTSVNYAQGVDSNVTLSVGMHTTSLAFGVLQSDVSLGIRAYQSKTDRFGLTVTPGVHVLYDLYENNFRTYPQLEATTWWQYSESKQHLIYGGLGTWIELFKQKAHGQVQTNEVMPWITVGHQFNLERWSYLTEFKYLGFQHKTAPSVVDFVSPGGNGTIGFYFGVSRTIGK